MGGRILVVDDHPSNLELELYLLHAFGHEAESAHDGNDALAALRGRTYDAVLVDLLMPGMDGYEFARRVRAEMPHVRAPLIAVTALAMAGDRERILSSGFDGYIAKPIDPATFVRDVEAHLLNEDERGNDPGR